MDEQTTVLAISCGLMASSSQFAYAKYRKYRPALFATALPLGMAIVFHARLLNDKEEYKKRLATGHLGLMTGCHILGAVFYVTRVRIQISLTIY